MSGLTDSNHPSSQSLSSELTNSVAPTSNHPPRPTNLLDKKPHGNVATNTISPDTSCEDLLGLTSVHETNSKSSHSGEEREAPSPPPSSPRSPRSHPSLTTYTKHYSESPLDKPTLAPPPIHPASLPGGGTSDPYMRSVKPHTNIQYRNGQLSPLPTYSQITHSGHISGRCSTTSLILKKWKRVFWVTYNDETELLVFRSKSDFDEWAMNPYMSVNQRNDLVKLRVCFKKGGRGNLGVKCIRVTQLHSKEYGKMGKMCQFKLEQWMHHGPVLVGAFASNSKPEAAAFQVILNAMIERHGYGVKHMLASSDDRDDIAGNILRNLVTPPMSTSVR